MDIVTGLEEKRFQRGQTPGSHFPPWVLPLCTWRANGRSQVETLQMKSPLIRKKEEKGGRDTEDTVHPGVSQALHTLGFISENVSHTLKPLFN